MSYYRHIPYGYLYNANSIIRQMNVEIESDKLGVYTIYIPSEYARLESNERIRKRDDAKEISHYEIYIVHQGTKPLDSAILLFKFPNSDTKYSVLVTRDNGTSFMKDAHKNILRESDELDRRIILGFCNMYASNLIDATYHDGYHSMERTLDWLSNEALSYKSSMQPKRIKNGCYSPRLSKTNIIEGTEFVSSGFIALMEYNKNIFNNLAII